jgi:hypothetical protein
LDHNPTIGQAREFLVKRLLKTLLPSAVYIGSGKVIDHQGRHSKQIDIILYDPRFPMLNLDGGGLFFVEGVLATIEIKSTMTSDALRASLENCKSVLDLSPCGEHPKEAAARIRFYEQAGGLTHSEGEQQFQYMFRPATYIFAFNSTLSLEATTSCVRSWWQGGGCSYSTRFPVLPRVLTAGKIVGVTNDGRIRLQTTDGPPAHVMALFRTAQRFRWLAIHLMDSVSQRLGLRNFGEQFDYRLSDYYPWASYVDAINSGDTKTIYRMTTAGPPVC